MLVLNRVVWWIGLEGEGACGRLMDVMNMNEHYSNILRYISTHRFLHIKRTPSRKDEQLACSLAG